MVRTARSATDEEPTSRRDRDADRDTLNEIILGDHLDDRSDRRRHREGRRRPGKRCTTSSPLDDFEFWFNIVTPMTGQPATHALASSSSSTENSRASPGVIQP